MFYSSCRPDRDPIPTSEWWLQSHHCRPRPPSSSSSPSSSARSASSSLLSSSPKGVSVLFGQAGLWLWHGSGLSLDSNLHHAIPHTTYHAIPQRAYHTTYHAIHHTPCHNTLHVHIPCQSILFLATLYQILNVVLVQYRSLWMYHQIHPCRAIVLKSMYTYQCIPPWYWWENGLYIPSHLYTSVEPSDFPRASGNISGLGDVLPSTSLGSVPIQYPSVLKLSVQCL